MTLTVTLSSHLNFEETVGKTKQMRKTENFLKTSTRKSETSVFASVTGILDKQLWLKVINCGKTETCEKFLSPTFAKTMDSCNLRLVILFLAISERLEGLRASMG